MNSIFHRQKQLIAAQSIKIHVFYVYKKNKNTCRIPSHTKDKQCSQLKFEYIQNIHAAYCATLCIGSEYHAAIIQVNHPSAHLQTNVSIQRW